MNINNSKATRDLENLGGELAEHVQQLLDDGHSPFLVADAIILAGAALWLEVTKSDSLANTFKTLSENFARNEPNPQMEIRH